MIKQRWLLLALLAPGLLASCGGKDGGGFQELFDLQAEIIDWSCECAVMAGGYPDQASCVEALSGFGYSDSEEACLAKELSGATVDAAVDCALSAGNEYLDCLKSEGCPDYTATFECDDGSTVPQSFVCDGENDCADGEDEADCGPENTTCDAAYYAKLDACPEVPQADLQAAEMACGISNDGQ